MRDLKKLNNAQLNALEEYLALEKYLADEEFGGVDTQGEHERVLAEIADRRAERLKGVFK